MFLPLHSVPFYFKALRSRLRVEATNLPISKTLNIKIENNTAIAQSNKLGVRTSNNVWMPGV